MNGKAAEKHALVRQRQLPRSMKSFQNHWIGMHLYQVDFFLPHLLTTPRELLDIRKAT